MSITNNDRNYMNKVSQYYKKVSVKHDRTGSIRETAIHFDISRTKVRKMLITTGTIKSEITDKALCLRKQGLSNKEIAKEMGLSESTVSTYLPYENIIYNSPDASKHAKDQRRYREKILPKR